MRHQGTKLGRLKVAPNVEKAIHGHLSAGNGILKVAALVGCGSGTVQRVKREMDCWALRDADGRVFDRLRPAPL